MVDHEVFSALLLSKLFPPAFLEEFPFYRAEAGRSFDTEYLGGQWDEVGIDGVQFWFPEAAPDKLGVVEVWGSRYFATGPARDKPEPGGAWLFPPWVANADRVLGALGLPVRIGSDEAAVRALATGKVMASDYPADWYRAVGQKADGSIRSLSFACRAPGVYHVSAVVHATEGLLKLEVRRPDLIRANDHEGAYDLCFGALFDEGPASHAR